MLLSNFIEQCSCGILHGAMKRSVQAEPAVEVELLQNILLLSFEDKKHAWHSSAEFCKHHEAKKEKQYPTSSKLKYTI